MKNNSLNTVSFGSIKPQMRAAEMVLKTFNKEMGPIKSSTKIDTKISSHNSNEKYSEIIECLKIIKDKLFRQIDTPEVDDLYGKSYKSFGEAAETFKAHIKNNDGKTNCREIPIIIMNMLQKKGIKSECFEMSPQIMGAGGSHSSVVIGLKKNADISKPSTWGNKAIIIDGWKNIVLKAQDGLRLLKQDLTGTNSDVPYDFRNTNPRKYLQIGEKALN